MNPKAGAILPQSPHYHSLEAQWEERTKIDEWAVLAGEYTDAIWLQIHRLKLGRALISVGLGYTVAGMVSMKRVEYSV